ncbi:MAG: methane monooxygenase/ammonia monooxygenase subunit B [Cycloclasticus sp.]|nr:methane monooxygenase/ammonia monooxygenase subunit B [Cycloclasticus sp.]MBQ0789311.1 methane monooxygenase/ammonia monooxygenase subunit B [Cycloclasticus sp.]
MTTMKSSKRNALNVRAALIKSVLLMVLMCVTGLVLAHGERNQEPFLRMKTLHWYDIKWSVENDSTIQVNDLVEMTGKVHFFSRWPEVINKPSTIFLGNATPGPVFVRVETYLDGVPMIQSTGVEMGHVYDFKVILKARIPGRHHVHPMINVESAGGLVGPGIWITVAGDADDFVYSITTRTGTEIANLGSYAVPNVIKWHAIWATVGVLWLLWWFRRPLIIQRYLLVKQGSWDQLITNNDRKIAATLIVGIIVTLIYANNITKEKYPRTVPLQGSKAHVDVPVNKYAGMVTVKNLSAEYYLPGRTVTVKAKITNNTNSPIQLGEFTAANIRFVNHSVPAAMKGVDVGYPDELVANDSLKVSDQTPIQPGETKILDIEATDVAWETERLSSLLNDPDSSYGALLFFYNAKGERIIEEIYGQIIPTFID